MTERAVSETQQPAIFLELDGRQVFALDLCKPFVGHRLKHVGGEQRALLVIDDFSRLSTFTNTAFNSLFDVDQIEVYRSPQSTLRGRNAIAGAFVVTTREPEFTCSGRVLAEYNHDDVAGEGYRIAGAVSFPILNDVLAVRISGERNVDRDPVSRLLPGEYTGTDSFDVARRIEGNRANLKVRFEPQDGTRFDRIANYARATGLLTVLRGHSSHYATFASNASGLMPPRYE